MFPLRSPGGGANVPPRQPAAILIQLERQHPDKQEALCLEYAEAHRLQCIAMCYHIDDCRALVMSGAVSVVVAAIDPGESLGEDIERFGGKLHIVRNIRTSITRGIAHLVQRMYRRGLDAATIAEILGVSLQDVKRTLFRQGIKPRSPEN